MNALTLFNYEKNEVRTTVMDGEPWFVAKDIALALGYTWSGSRIAHVPEEWKGATSVVTPSGKQDMAVISEAGLFFFLGRSDKPAALPMQKWIAGEVLPSIRKTGSYGHQPIDPLKALSDPATMRGLLLTYTEKVLSLESIVAEQAPKVALANKIESSTRSIELGEYAKAISSTESFVIGRNNLFAWLRFEKIIYGSKNMPFQKYIDNGWFEVTEGFYENKNTNGPIPTFKTVITGKGQVSLLAKMTQSEHLQKFAKIKTQKSLAEVN